jgi:hypothetical protein
MRRQLGEAPHIAHIPRCQTHDNAPCPQQRRSEPVPKWSLR